MPGSHGEERAEHCRGARTTCPPPPPATRTTRRRRGPPGRSTLARSSPRCRPPGSSACPAAASWPPSTPSHPQQVHPRHTTLRQIQLAPIMLQLALMMLQLALMMLHLVPLTATPVQQQTPPVVTMLRGRQLTPTARHLRTRSSLLQPSPAEAAAQPMERGQRSPSTMEDRGRAGTIMHPRSCLSMLPRKHLEGTNRSKWSTNPSHVSPPPDQCFMASQLSVVTIKPLCADVCRRLLSTPQHPIRPNA